MQNRERLSRWLKEVDVVFKSLLILKLYSIDNDRCSKLALEFSYSQDEDQQIVQSFSANYKSLR